MNKRKLRNISRISCTDKRSLSKNDVRLSWSIHRNCTATRASYDLQALLLLVILSFSATTITTAQWASSSTFNYEVEKRVHERLVEYMSGPVLALEFLKRHVETAQALDLRDRTQAIQLLYSLGGTFGQEIYYGLEDGTFVGVFGTEANYREPGESGYDISGGSNEAFRLHYPTCVDRETGVPENCTMPPGDDYVECVDGCALIPCPSSPPPPPSFSMSLTSSSAGSIMKWCRNYVRKQTPDANNRTTTSFGYIPRTYHCIDQRGLVTEEIGQVVLEEEKDGTTSTTTSSCYYGDGKTLVQRSNTIIGPYAACQTSQSCSNIQANNNTSGLPQICGNTFTGGYRSRNYDPRWRSWYEITKKDQTNQWLPPYLFFSLARMGITYAQPIYKQIVQNNNNETVRVFEGVLAVDYVLEDIVKFLADAYMHDDNVHVLIVEATEPNYLIGSSTGSSVARRVQKHNESIPCPDEMATAKECTPVRQTVMDTLESDNPMDVVLARAFVEQQNQQFPRIKLVTSRATEEENIDSDAYVSRSLMYAQEDANLQWRIIIAIPMERAANDAITKGHSLFVPMILAGTLGIVICLGLLGVYYFYRHNIHVILSDWRFTSAFIVGCTLLNGSTYTLVGPNTTEMCVLRMWAFHLVFAVALSPLLIKVWRMNQLVGEGSGAQAFRRLKISHKRAALYTLPIVGTQILILTLFSILDPPKETSYLDVADDGNGSDGNYQHTVCQQNSMAFMVVQLIFEGGLVLGGCLLAYQTRNLSDDYGESKQLIFAMHNIAFIGTVTILVVNLLDVDEAGKSAMIAVGILWGTVMSAAAFSLPRLMRLRSANMRSSILRGSTTVNALRQTTRGRPNDLRLSTQIKPNISQPTGSSGIEMSSATKTENEATRSTD